MGRGQMLVTGVEGLQSHLGRCRRRGDKRRSRCLLSERAVVRAFLPLRLSIYLKTRVRACKWLKVSFCGVLR